MSTTHDEFYHITGNTKLSWSVILVLVLYVYRSCLFVVPELTGEYNFTIQAIPERPNGLLLALTNNTDLVYAIGTRERKVINNPKYTLLKIPMPQGLYYANNMTEEFSSDCPSLITVDIVSDGNIIMITGSSSVNVTQSGLLNLYIGGLPSKDEISHSKQLLYPMTKMWYVMGCCFAKCLETI